MVVSFDEEEVVLNTQAKPGTKMKRRKGCRKWREVAGKRMDQGGERLRDGALGFNNEFLF